MFFVCIYSTSGLLFILLRENLVDRKQNNWTRNSRPGANREGFYSIDGNAAFFFILFESLFRVFFFSLTRTVSRPTAIWRANK